jgi:hypothetical protein
LLVLQNNKTSIVVNDESFIFKILWLISYNKSSKFQQYDLHLHTFLNKVFELKKKTQLSLNKENLSSRFERKTKIYKKEGKH